MNAVSRLLVAAATATAISVPLAASAQDVQLTYLTHWAPDTVALLEAAASAYSATNPNVKIAVRAVPFGDLLTTIRSGGADGPTIASIYDLWLPALVKDGLVVPAPEAVAADVKSNWPAGISAAASVNGKVYGVPNEINVYALNYNKKLFEEAGIAGPPKTWDELKDAAAKLTDA